MILSFFLVMLFFQEPIVVQTHEDSTAKEKSTSGDSHSKIKFKVAILKIYDDLTRSAVPQYIKDFEENSNKNLKVTILNEYVSNRAVISDKLFDEIMKYDIVIGPTSSGDLDNIDSKLSQVKDADPPLFIAPIVTGVSLADMRSDAFKNNYRLLLPAVNESARAEKILDYLNSVQIKKAAVIYRDNTRWDRVFSESISSKRSKYIPPEVIRYPMNNENSFKKIIDECFKLDIKAIISVASPGNEYLGIVHPVYVIDRDPFRSYRPLFIVNADRKEVSKIANTSKYDNFRFLFLTEAANVLNDESEFDVQYHDVSMALNIAANDVSVVKVSQLYAKMHSLFYRQPEMPGESNNFKTIKMNNYGSHHSAIDDIKIYRYNDGEKISITSGDSLINVFWYTNPQFVFVLPFLLILSTIATSVKFQESTFARFVHIVQSSQFYMISFFNFILCAIMYFLYCRSTDFHSGSYLAPVVIGVVSPNIVFLILRGLSHQRVPFSEIVNSFILAVEEKIERMYADSIPAALDDEIISQIADKNKLRSVRLYCMDSILMLTGLRTRRKMMEKLRAGLEQIETQQQDFITEAEANKLRSRLYLRTYFQTLFFLKQNKAMFMQGVRRSGLIGSDLLESEH